MQLIEAFYEDLTDALQGRGWQPVLALKGRLLSGDWLDELSNRFMNQVQFTPPRTCLSENPDETIEQLFLRFVVGRRRVLPPPRILDRTEIRYRSEVLLKQWVGPARVARPVEIRGVTASHSFDLGLTNGVVTAALHAVSFQIPSKIDTILHRDHIAAAAYDIHRSLGDFPIYAIVAPPARESDGLFDESRHMLEQQEVKIVSVQELANWRDYIVRSLFR